MSSPLLDLLAGYFSEELVYERPIMRSSLYNGGPAGVETTKAQFRELLTARTMTHKEFYRETMAFFPDDEVLYRELADAYRFFFDDSRRDRPGPHPNWDFAVGLLAAVLPGSTGYSPAKITGHAPEDWQPFDVETRDMDEVEDDLLEHCSEMTGPLVVVNDTSFATYAFKHGPYFVEAGQLREFAKTFGERVGSYLMDGHVFVVSPVTGIVVMVMDDGLIATLRGRPVLQLLS